MIGLLPYAVKLLVLSDIHLEFGTFEVPADIEYDVAILAGDIAVPGVKAVHWAARASTFGRASDVLLVAGNHEFYGRCLQPQIAAMKQATNQRVDFLDCDEVIIRGVRFLGCTLWTDFGLRIHTSKGMVSDPQRAMQECRSKMTDYSQIRTQTYESEFGAMYQTLKPEHTREIHQQQRAWLGAKLAEPFNGPTVVITHHAPHRNSVLDYYAGDWISTAYASELPSHFFDVPVLWVHGHQHDPFDYRVGNCRVVCNPRGYVHSIPPEDNEGFNPRFIVEIESAP
ncbi:MAG: metallophosphoesterase [Steroidobacteraceae bacterium]